nr:glycoside hydrolase family 65 protein [Chloroflexota bacterium]
MSQHLPREAALYHSPSPSPADTWRITESAFAPTRQHTGESLFTLSNGHLGTRGAFEEGYPGDWPATFIHGIYDDALIGCTELANAPNWLPFDLLVEGERFCLDHGEVLSYRRELDMFHGLLTRTVRWRSPAGRTVDIAIERFASLADPHLCAIRYEVTPLDFDGAIEWRAGLNGHVGNRDTLHWDILGHGERHGIVWLHSRTRGTGIELGQAARLTVAPAGESERFCLDCNGYPQAVGRVRARRGQPISAEKIVSVFSLRESPEARITAIEKLQGLGVGYDNLRAAHAGEWEKYWRVSDVVIEGDDEAQQAVRFGLFHLLAAAPRHDEWVSIGPKALSGFAYRGHVFWDTEIFMLPFFTLTQPELARNLLMYRYHTLPGARRKAAANGFEGAQYAWESADTGDEVTPAWVPRRNQREPVRIWTGDLELHISSDVAYAVWQYWQATGDEVLLANYGAEIILDTAVFWGSRAEWNADKGRYEIKDVVGPDEYHDRVNNNAFTNHLVRWHLETAQAVWRWLEQNHPARADALAAQLKLQTQTFARWADVATRLSAPVDPVTSLIEQFDGYFERRDVNLAEHLPRTASMQVLLGIEGVNQTQILKQPDALMLFFMLRDRYDARTLRANWDYYAPRTDHAYGSSLGPAVHSLLACEIGEPEVAYEHFRRAAQADLDDGRGNTADGIHAASIGGLWQAVVFGFGGLRLAREGWTATPRPPAHWQRLAFRFYYRGKLEEVDWRRDG